MKWSFVEIEKAVVFDELENWRGTEQEQVEREIAGRMIVCLAAGEIIGILEARATAVRGN